MKLIITSAAAVLIATSAFADNSDRYNDQRLDTSVSTQQASAANDQPIAPIASLSTRNEVKTPTSYPYSNPYGVGPNNDSR